MPDDEFNRHKDALAAQILEKPKSLYELSWKLSNEITTQQYHFDRPEKEVAVLRTVTKSDLLDYYKRNILSTGPNRASLSVHIVSTAEGGAGNSNDIDENSGKSVQIDRNLNIIQINDLTIFKSSKELYPIVQPYIDIPLKGAKSKF